MRLSCGRLLTSAAWLIICVLAVQSSAHDIPNARIERATQVIIQRGLLRVEYEVSLGELTLVRDLRQFDQESVAGDRLALFDRYARLVGPLNARGFLVQIEGTDVSLTLENYSIVVEEHPRFKFQFVARIPFRGRLVIVDTNYASSEGTTRLAVKSTPGIEISGHLPPTRVESIPIRPSWQLTDLDERRSQRLDLRYDLEQGDDPRPAAAAQPSRTILSSSTSVMGWSVARLLDRRSANAAIGWSLGAFLLGMFHALQPGHGKTLVAAATVGESAVGPLQGAWLGLVTAACHLIGVIALAIVVWACSTNRFAAIHIPIARTSGFIIAATGAFRLGRCLAGQGHGDDHPLGLNGGVWSLGLAAGFIPCWDAVALLILAQSTGQIAWGLMLLIAFSGGLGVVLTTTGLVAGRLRNQIVCYPWSFDLGRWFGLGSALALLVIGVGLLRPWSIWV